ncbi:hypothetical protein F1D05_37425 [Kribbella qitaiheensis]|uniref:Universal stress protein n=1 Tax=Kribbella qitaiheensis TaxID=1544730 RepID=A0A7G6X8H9_9ACTN|nr:hypothetical protein [Kribbella qitaiheensis]QNE22544.1 hypothetical protein F1D05_37425 [Kribbella qitaiheensis]
MTYDVVVLIEREMSEGDARRVAALHAKRDEVVDYHLLISSHPTEGIGGPMALLGSSFADVTGMSGASPDRTTTATALADPQFDLASVIEHSSRRLRGLNDCRVNVSITHGEVLLGLKTLVASTKSEEVVVVAWPETVARFLCSDWPTQARKALNVPRIRVIEHIT